MGGTAGRPGDRVAYLVLSHGPPAAAARLTEAVLRSSATGQVFIHHDGPTPDRFVTAGSPERVHLLADVRPVTWGDWSMVEAMLRLTESARATAAPEWFVFLSADTMPVRPLAEWEHELTMSAASAYTTIWPTARARWGHPPAGPERGFARVAYRWRPLAAARGPMKVVLRALEWLSRYCQPLFAVEYLSRRDAYFLGVPRRGELRLEPHLVRGPQWIAFDSRAAEAFLAAREWQQLGRDSLIPDQSFFQTVLTDSRLPILTVNPVYSSTGPGVMLTREEIPAIVASGAAFARKFDLDHYPSLHEEVAQEVTRARSRPHVPPAAGHERWPDTTAWSG